MTKRIITLAILAGCSQTPTESSGSEPAFEPQEVVSAVDTETPTIDSPDVALDLSTEVRMAPTSDHEGSTEMDEYCPSFQLRRGETLAHFARWSEVPVEVIAEHSGLDLSGTYSVGTEISVPVEGETLASLISARDGHHIQRAEGYLNGRGGTQQAGFLTVATGDTAWGLAHDRLDIPVWLLETYNPSVDLDDLHPGQELMYPVLTDRLVADDPSPEDERLALQ